MALFNSTCPNCDGPLEMRKFMDGGADINPDWWCPACQLRWLSMEIEPMEAEAGE